MPIQVTCGCGAEYLFKDEHKGKSLSCRSCDAVVVVPSGSGEYLALAAPPPDDGKGPFERDLFRMRQRIFSITECYEFYGAGGRLVLYAERPVRWLRSLASVAGGLAVGYLVIKAGFWAFELSGLDLRHVLLVMAGVAAGGVTMIATNPKRDAFFYADESKAEPLLRVKQDQVWAPFTLTYTVTDPSGAVLAVLRKNHIYDWWRRRWHVLRPDGSLWALSQEDTLVLALLRRFLGNLYGLLRVNFVIDDGAGKRLGRFGRDLNLFDRYTLDLGPDIPRAFDRRVAAALAVMLDTGERR